MANMNSQYGPNNGYMPGDSRFSSPQQPVYAVPPSSYPIPPAPRSTYPPINGRTVISEDEITPRDVPMDGTVTYFPKADGSEIIGKYWDNTGTLQAVRYVRQPIPNQNGSENMVSLDMVMAKLDEIDGKLNRKPTYPKKPYKPRPTNNSTSIKEES